MLLKACDKNGPKDCALIPLNHCLHTPGGPLKVKITMKTMSLSLEIDNLARFFLESVFT